MANRESSLGHWGFSRPAARVAAALGCLLLFGLQLPVVSSAYAAPPAHLTAAAANKNKNVVTFGTQTASATKPDGRGIYYVFGGAGGTVPDHVAVLNYSTKPLTLLVRATDAVNTPQGGFAAVPINQASHDVGTWIALPKGDLSVNLPPRSDIIIPFLVEIPKSATPGDHFGVITATLVSSITSTNGPRAHLDQTVGTRVFVRVSGPLHPSLAVKHLKVNYKGTLNPIGKGTAVLTYDVVNTGNVALGGNQTVSVSGLFGSKVVAAHTAQVQLLLPGFSVPEKVTIHGVIPELLDTAHVSVSLLYVPGTSQPKTGPFSASDQFWAIPWTLIAIILVIILAAVGWMMRRRRRRRKPGPTSADPGKTPAGAEVESGPEKAESTAETSDKETV